jgi:hypothetical protein
MPGSPQWSLSLRLPHQNPIHASLLTIRTARPAHVILDFITRTILGQQYRSLSPSLWSFIYSSVTSSLLGPNILLKHPQPTFIPQCQRPSFTPIQHDLKLWLIRLP